VAAKGEKFAQKIKKMKIISEIVQKKRNRVFFLLTSRLIVALYFGRKKVGENKKISSLSSFCVYLFGLETLAFQGKGFFM